MDRWVKCPMCGQNNMPGDDECIKCRTKLVPGKLPQVADAPETVAVHRAETTPPSADESSWSDSTSLSRLGSHKWIVIAAGTIGTLLGLCLEYFLAAHFQWAANWQAIRLFPGGSYRSRHWTLLELVVVVPLLLAGTYGGYALARAIQSKSKRNL